MKRKATMLWVFAWLLMASSLSFAQTYTVITANNVIVDNGSGTPVNPPSGTNLCYLGVNSSGAAITYTPAGGSPVSGPVCQTLNSSGALTGSLQVANAATASPAGLLYTITVVNGSTTYLTVPKVSVTGTLFPYDTYAITGNGSVLGIGYPHIGCNVGAQWTSTTINPGGAGCVLVSGSGAWATYPQYPQYCPYGQAYLAPQGAGTVPLCLSASLTGNGSPTGACVNKSTYFQQNAATGAFLWGCVNSAWQQITGGSGGGGLTSFNGRTTAAATLMSSDITAIFGGSPFNFTGGGGLAYDSATGTPTASINWKQIAGALLGNGNIGVYASGFSGTPTFFVNALTGAMSAAAGNFAVGSGGALAFGGGVNISSSNNVCQTNGTNCPGASSVFYQNVQNDTSSVQTQRNKTSYVTASGVHSADDSGNSSTDISLSAIPNASLANPGVTINTVGGVSGGGTVALGSSLTITGSPTFTPDNQSCSGTCTFSETATYNHVIVTGNVMASTLAAGSDGFCTNINIEQNSTGGFTFVLPSNISLVPSNFIRTLANQVSTGQFCYSVADSSWRYQVSSAVTGLSGAVTAPCCGVAAATITATGVTPGTYVIGGTSITFNAGGQATSVGPPFSATFGCTQCGTYEVGYSGITSASGTISYANPTVPTSASVSDGTNTTTLSTPFTSWTLSHTYTTNTCFTLTAVGNGQTVTPSNCITFLTRVFGGVGAAGATSSVTASGTTAVLSNGAVLANEGLSASQVGMVFGPFTPSGQKIYLLLIGSGHTFKDNSTGFAFPMLTPTAVSFVNQYGATVTMYLYESTNILSGTFNILVTS